MLNKTSLKFISGFVLIIAVSVVVVLFTGVYGREVGDIVDGTSAVTAN